MGYVWIGVKLDTENNSSDLYAHLGSFNVIPMQPPYIPESYVNALLLAYSEGMEVAIVDSISHEWEGSGGILEMHSNMTGNSFTNWSKLTPRYNAFMEHLLQTDMHIIATLRTKQDYVLVEKNGKQVPEKVGLKSIQREGTDYEFTLVLDLDIKHHATASKDRTGLFMDKPSFIPGIGAGISILEWCQQGNSINNESLEGKVNSCKSIGELIELYKASEEYQVSHANLFTDRKAQLQVTAKNILIIKILFKNEYKYDRNIRDN